MGRRSRFAIRLLATALLIFAAAVAPAAATTAGTPLPHLREPGLSFHYYCFGNLGTFKAPVLNLDGIGGHDTWPDGNVGCYGISPGRAIYQTNTTANRWYVIPGNGRADYIYSHYQTGGTKVLVVGVTGGHLYYNTYSSGAWHTWRLYR